MSLYWVYGIQREPSNIENKKEITFTFSFFFYKGGRYFMTCLERLFE